jgi:hypothetical protein
MTTQNTTESDHHGICGTCDWMGGDRPTYDAAQQDVDNHIASHPGHSATVV